MHYLVYIRYLWTRHVLTFNPNSAKPGEEIYVNIPKLKADSVLVPDSMALVFDFKNSNTKSWFRNNLGKLLQKRLEKRFTTTVEKACWRSTRTYGYTGNSVTTLWRMVSPAKPQGKNIQRRCCKRQCGCYRISSIPKKVYDFLEGLWEFF
jgi:hypothetical protein